MEDEERIKATFEGIKYMVTVLHIDYHRLVRVYGDSKEVKWLNKVDPRFYGTAQRRIMGGILSDISKLCVDPYGLHFERLLKIAKKRGDDILHLSLSKKLGRIRIEYGNVLHQFTVQLKGHKKVSQENYPKINEKCKTITFRTRERVDNILGRIRSFMNEFEVYYWEEGAGTFMS